jgi:hypothetical protein
MIERANAPDGNSFDILWNGKKVLYAVRETLPDEALIDGRRGHWLLMLDTLAGPMIAARNQYSNDLMELAQMHCDGSRPFGAGISTKFRVECSQAEYLAKVHDWIADIEFEFGGDWTSDYYEWEGRAVLMRKVS